MRARCESLLASSPSQLRQDLFALCVCDFVDDGFFVEFGACDGLTLSNSVLLERDFGWRGILGEPATMWHEALFENRPDAAIETDCVYSETGATLEFTQAASGPMSSLKRDAKFKKRRQGETYPVKTISLLDMLRKHDAPQVIDYLSVDTEGSEFEILHAFDFAKYRFRVITVEHNFYPYRKQIHALLSKHGYRQILPEISYFDDWYLGPGETAFSP